MAGKQRTDLSANYLGPGLYGWPHGVAVVKLRPDLWEVRAEPTEAGWAVVIVQYGTLRDAANYAKSVSERRARAAVEGGG